MIMSKINKESLILQPKLHVDIDPVAKSLLVKSFMLRK